MVVPGRADRGIDPDAVLRLAAALHAAGAKAASIAAEVEHDVPAGTAAAVRTLRTVTRWADAQASDMRRRAYDIVQSESAGDAADRQRLCAALQQPWLADETLSVLQFDPSGDGRVTLARGDPATADHVTVLVPGAETTLENLDALYLPWLEAIHAATGERLASPKTHATVLWLGYDAPDSSVWNAPSSSYAESAAPEFATFIDALGPRRDAHVTLIGHSYGAVVVGAAAAQLDIDDFLALGAPGIGADEAVDELGLPGSTTVSTATAARDPIRWAQDLIHNEDPEEVRGVIVLDPGTDAFEGKTAVGVHMAYAAVGSTSVAMIADIAAGGRAARKRASPGVSRRQPPE